MAVKASATITLSFMVDITAVFRYYKLQSSTAAAPGVPTTNPPSGWTDTEPSYTNGSTSTLYFVDLTVFTNNEFVYSSVSKSSSYEAAKAAYNKAVAAGAAADEANDKVDNIQVGGTNLTRGSLSEWSKWRTPNPNLANQCFDVGYSYLPDNKSVGDEYTTTVEIEYSGFTAGSGGTFDLYSQGKVDDNWPQNTARNVVIKDLVSHKTPPADGVYRYSVTNTIASEIIDAIKFQFQIRIDYCGAGKFRFRKLKTEKGNKATDYSPSPEDIKSEVNTLKSYVNIDTSGSTPKLTLGSDGNNFKVEITNDSMNFKDGDKTPAQITNEKLLIKDAKVTDTLYFGNCSFEPRPNGHVGLIWRGE